MLEFLLDLPELLRLAVGLPPLLAIVDGVKPMRDQLTCVMRAAARSLQTFARLLRAAAPRNAKAHFATRTAVRWRKAKDPRRRVTAHPQNQVATVAVAATLCRLHLAHGEQMQARDGTFASVPRGFGG